MLIKLNKDNVWFKGSNLSREPVSVCDAVAIVTWAKVWILTIFIHSRSIKWENMGRNKAFASSSSPFPAWVPDLALPSNLVSSHCIMGVMLYLFKKNTFMWLYVYMHMHTRAWVKRSGDILSSYISWSINSGVSLGGKCLFPLSHLASSRGIVFFSSFCSQLA